MSPYIAGHPPKAPTSYWPPALQLALGGGLIWLALWANGHAQTGPATEAWIFNALSAVSGLAGLLWLPFAVGALYVVIRNRRKGVGVVRR